MNNALDIVDRLKLLARGDHLDLADIVCGDAVAEIERLRAMLEIIAGSSDRLQGLQARAALDNIGAKV